MNTFKINVSELNEYIPQLRAGDKVILSGTVYTARDAAHKKIYELINAQKPLPFELKGSVIYYAGPTPTPNNLPIGSCGPTTSSRMDFYAPILYDKGVIATIGKGERNEQVIKSIINNKAIYFCAIGGAGALAALCIKSNEVIAFEELGCESIKKLEFDNFPLTVAIDSFGECIFKS